MASNVPPALHWPALHWPISFCLFSSTAILAISVITSNVGTIDRAWTLLPTIYTAYFALAPLWPDHADVPKVSVGGASLTLIPYKPQGVDGTEDRLFCKRALLMLVLVTIWMFRLGYNTYRRGLFNPKDEDYRWKTLRRQLNPIVFQIFNITFITFIQNILLFSLSLPTYLATALPTAHEELTSTDYVLCITTLLVLALEFTADNQQWAFQNFKRLFREEHGDVNKVTSFVMPTLPSSAHWPFAMIQFTPADARRGFITKGLWAWSRHPNFFCEQSFWVLITLFPVLSLPLPTLPSIQKDPLSIISPFIPALCHIALFIGSTVFTESISREHYPEAYPVYQKRVGMFLTGPWVWLLGAEEWKKAERVLWGRGGEKEE